MTTTIIARRSRRRRRLHPFLLNSPSSSQQHDDRQTTSRKRRSVRRLSASRRSCSSCVVLFITIIVVVIISSAAICCNSFQQHASVLQQQQPQQYSLTPCSRTRRRRRLAAAAATPPGEVVMDDDDDGVVQVRGVDVDETTTAAIITAAEASQHHTTNKKSQSPLLLQQKKSSSQIIIRPAAAAAAATAAEESANIQQQKINNPNQQQHTNNIDRRSALFSIMMASTAAVLVGTTTAEPADAAYSPATLEDLSLGNGRWIQLDRSTLSSSSVSDNTSAGTAIVPSFCTYLARFLINYDVGVKTWWDGLEHKYSLLSFRERQTKLGKMFGGFAKSLELGLVQQNTDTATSSSSSSSSSRREAYVSLWDSLQSKYGNNNPDAKRHIAILFALLPEDQQPTSRIKNEVGGSNTVSYEQAIESADNVYSKSREPIVESLNDDFTALLPEPYRCVQIQGGPLQQEQSCYTIYPAVPIYAMEGFDDSDTEEEEDADEFVPLLSITATTFTPFGPLGSEPLIREQPQYPWDTYALFGLSGATGCALTHSIVVPLDVVKTRNQVDAELYPDFLSSGIRILKEEGIEGLFLGFQATVAGFFWYGLSVYPSYTFFKRTFTYGPLLTPEVATVHANDISLIAGAFAAVIASFGLTPLEAARIRCVADPEQYRPIGLVGTLKTIASEDPTLGWKSLYAGLPSLLTRQVIFGSVKFLAFERACDFIFNVWPFLRDETWTSLAVSLVAGGISGTLSSVVSQPADSVLTYVAQNSEVVTNNQQNQGTLGVIEGCRIMVEKEGPESLFNGLGSRCIWAGSIIAGQFLLYDVFRTYFGVNSDDLSQVYQVIIPQ